MERASVVIVSLERVAITIATILVTIVIVLDTCQLVDLDS